MVNIAHHLPPPPVLPSSAKAYALDANGHIHLATRHDQLAVSAVLVKMRGGISEPDLRYAIDNGAAGADAMAVNPATVMRDFLARFSTARGKCCC